MGQVWELDLPHNQQSVLLAFADHADDEGYNARPGIEYVAWKTGYSERQVQRIVRELERVELLVEVAAAAGRKATAYRVVVAAGHRKAPYQPRHEREPNAMTDRRGDKMSGRHPGSSRGDIQVSPEPSREPNGSGLAANAAKPEPVRSSANAEERTSEPSSTSVALTANDPPATLKDKRSAAERNDDPAYVRLAELLADKIAENRDGRRPKPKDVEKWREPIRLMVERDELVGPQEAHGKSPAEIRKLTLDRIEYVIGWSQQDAFWRRNVLSGDTLREKYDQLEAAIRAEKAGNGPSAKAQGNQQARAMLRQQAGARA
jgi:Helix-turn-helix domain